MAEGIMEDRLDVARRRYQRARSAFDQSVGGVNAPELSSWLEHDLCSVVEELIDRPEYQAHARWPIDHLEEGVKTEERTLVNSLDSGLVQWAKRLTAFARRPGFKELPALAPGGNLQERCVSDAKDPDPASFLEPICCRPWRDLVVTRDYFYPVGDLNLKTLPSGPRVQNADFLPFFNPRLRLLGDFVSRTLIIRVEHWLELLRRFQTRCQTALHFADQDGGSPWGDIVESCRQMHDDKERLREKSFVGPNARVRNACIGLLQIYLAYRPLVKLNWLGIAPALSGGCQFFRRQVEVRGDVDLGDQAVAMLLDVATMYRTGLDSATIIAAKCRSHPLVLVTGTGRREAYWRGKLINVDWSLHSALWEFFAALAERATSRQGADMIDLTESIRGSMKDRRSRIKSLLPADLNEKIKPAGRGTYKLALEPREVCVLEYQGHESLTQRTGEPLAVI